MAKDGFISRILGIDHILLKATRRESKRERLQNLHMMVICSLPINLLGTFCQDEQESFSGLIKTESFSGLIKTRVLGNILCGH